MWFGLAAIALVGAIVLLYFDRVQRQRTGHARQVWAKSQGYTYVSVEPALPATWRRGALAKLGYLSAVDVVSGIRKGEKFVLFDLEDAATLVAVRRQIGSDIDVDMRLKTAAPPKDADLELLGAIGDRVVFATNPEIARHAVDQRMVAFIESLPDTVQMLWSEGNWTLGMLSVGTSSKDWETAIDAVLRLSGLLHVLPPVAEPRTVESGGHDPGRPHPNRQPQGESGAAGRKRSPEAGDESDRARADRPREQGRADRRREQAGADRPREQGGAGREAESEAGADGRAYAGRPYDDESEAPSGRRPSLAVVPDARQRTGAERSDDGAHEQASPDRSAAAARREETAAARREETSAARREEQAGVRREEPVGARRDRAGVPREEQVESRREAAIESRREAAAESRREAAAEARRDDDPAEASDARADLPPAGGPFHPGFRPYQGPVPR
ncbi:hypothetical protein IT779_17615 [Nocardia sp. NEAU-351]|uniref:Uncharacterized protein n=2 Tax=Nocardia bovistercoris TaxID=2785916 RepID=A0A931N184_9NOCA|nr:hypothetical protein [Nocardia bovistercoris]